MSRKAIPSILRIDIEPDDHIADANAKDWNGFIEYSTMVDKLRKQLPELSGMSFKANWFVRCDPDIERLYGRADHAAVQHENIFNHIISSNDALGIHVHDYRWDEKKQKVFSDLSDHEWCNHCLRYSFEAFTACFNEKPRMSSHGGYFLSDEILKTSVELGIEVDVTPEPGLEAKKSDSSLGEYATQPTTDYTNFPRKPYYPSLKGMHIPSTSDNDRHKIMLIPLTSYDYFRAQESWPRRTAKKIIGKKPTNHRPLSPWRAWPSPKVYWDYVEEAMNEQTNPYFAIAVRTDNPNSEVFKRVMSLLEYLPHHPIAKRLHFVDALDPEIRSLL